MSWKIHLLITLVSLYKEVLTQELQKDSFNTYRAVQQDQQNNPTNISVGVGTPTIQQYSNSDTLPIQQIYIKNPYLNNQPQDYYNNFFPLNPSTLKQESLTPCVCGVFLSGQFVPGGNSQPVGNPVLTHEYEDNFSCNAGGTKTCTNKCLDVLVKHLSNSPTIICGSIDRDCYKERAYLWIKNCNNSWVNTNLSAGREYCCKGGIPYKCPVISN